jgi:hypothetical protein
MIDDNQAILPINRIGKVRTSADFHPLTHLPFWAYF